jgi:hypothetical protein
MSRTLNFLVAIPHSCRVVPRRHGGRYQDHPRLYGKFEGVRRAPFHPPHHILVHPHHPNRPFAHPSSPSLPFVTLTPFPRRFGFVTFTDEAAAMAVKAMGSVELTGRKVTHRPSLPRAP